MSLINVCTRIFAASQQHPERLALSIPRMQGLQYLDEETIQYGELSERCAHMQCALTEQPPAKAGGLDITTKVEIRVKDPFRFPF